MTSGRWVALVLLAMPGEVRAQVDLEVELYQAALTNDLGSLADSAQAFPDEVWAFAHQEGDGSPKDCMLRATMIVVELSLRVAGRDLSPNWMTIENNVSTREGASTWARMNVRVAKQIFEGLDAPKLDQATPGSERNRRLVLLAELPKLQLLASQMRVLAALPPEEVRLLFGPTFNLLGRYRVQPHAAKDLQIDLELTFLDDGRSEWRAKIGDTRDLMVKRYRVRGRRLFVHHDLREQKAIIDRTGKKNPLAASILSRLAAGVPEVDVYTIDPQPDGSIVLRGRVGLILTRFSAN
ncbi:MAG: hypothetical protein AAFX94_03695 [Myxococcota bacterium]